VTLLEQTAEQNTQCHAHCNIITRSFYRTETNVTSAANRYKW